MKQNKKTTASLVVDTFGWIACSIVIFFFFTLWLFSYNNIDEPLKDAWSISATVFAALTALGAAYIAANLFNDWRDQHNKQVLAYDAKDVFELFYIQRDCIYSLKLEIENILNNKAKRSWNKIATDYERNIVSLYLADKDKMSAFCYLSEDRIIYSLTRDYYFELESISTALQKQADIPFSSTAYLDKNSAARIFSLLMRLEFKNSKILKELKTYVFVKKM